MPVAVLGRGPFGVVFLALGLAALALAVVLRESSWFLAAVAVPGATAGLVGAAVWSTGELSLRWLLLVAPLTSGAIFIARREGGVQTLNAIVTSTVVSCTFFLGGGFAAFLYEFQG
jgi:hypothetical protein